MKYSIRKISVVVIIVLLLVMLPVMPTAFAVNVTESESNNFFYEADTTQDDYTNYGKISSATDIDWWKITFSQSGIANFWLGNIPANCTYKMELYEIIEGDSTSRMAISYAPVNRQQIVRARVYAGVVYGIKIYSTSSYSSTQYTFRAKRYGLTKARLFTYEYAASGNNQGMNSRETATKVLPRLWRIGYDAEEFCNNSAGPAFNSLPNSSIFVVHNHAHPGIMAFYQQNTKWFAKASGNSIADDEDITSSDRVLTTLADNTGLNGVDLIVFKGCSSAVTDFAGGHGNLIEIALQKGARCAIGWTDATYTSDSIKWMDRFFYYIEYGYNLKDAISATNTWLSQQSGVVDIGSARSVDGLTSPLESVVLG